MKTGQSNLEVRDRAIKSFNKSIDKWRRDRPKRRYLQAFFSSLTEEEQRELILSDDTTQATKRKLRSSYKENSIK